MSKAKLFTKDFLIISFVNFFVAINYFLLMIIISEFAMNKFGSSPGEAGLAAGMVIFFCYSSVISFFSVYASTINLVDAASFFYIIFATVIFLTRPFVGRLFDAKGENIIMYSAILTLMIGMLIFSQAHVGYMLLLAGAVIGLGFGAIQSSGQAIAVKSAEPHRMGLATSTYFMLADIGMGSGPLIFGSVIPFTGYRGMYLCVIIIMAACLLLYYLLHGKKAAWGELRTSRGA